MKTIQVKLDYNNGYSEDKIELTEQDAFRLFKWFGNSDFDGDGYLRFYDTETGKPWKIGRAYIPELFSTEEFWDNSNGREIAEKWGLDEVGQAYYFTPEDYEKLKAELDSNPHWREWNENQRYWEYNVELEIVEANGELE